MWPFKKKKVRPVVMVKAAKKHNRRTKAQLMADRKKELRELVELKRLEQQMERLERGIGGDGDELDIRLASLPGLERRLSAAGLKLVPRNGPGGDDDGLKGAVKEFAGSEAGSTVLAALLPAVLARFGLLGTAAQVAPQQQPSPQISVSQPAAQQNAMPESQPNPQLGQPQVSAESQQLIAELQQRTAEQAVQWLREQKRTEYDALVSQLGACKTREDIVALFKIVLQLKPEFQGVIEWLCGNPTYIDGMITAVNARSAEVPAHKSPEGERSRKQHGL